MAPPPRLLSFYGMMTLEKLPSLYKHSVPSRDLCTDIQVRHRPTNLAEER